MGVTGLMDVAPDRWMTQLYGVLGPRQFWEIAMPGSHDAGMAYLSHITVGTTDCNTRTQYFPIARQLELGVRYFDIRPAIWSRSPGFHLAHYSYNDKLGLLGGTGEPLGEVLGAIGSFLTQPGRENEVVILRFSHYGNLDRKESFTLEEFSALLGEVRGIIGSLLYRPSANGMRINNLTFQTIGNGAGRVIAGFEDLPKELHRPDQGILSYGDEGDSNANLSVFDHYSDTESYSFMSTNQWGKFGAFQPRDGCLFLLSWTLTQSPFDSVAGAGGLGNCIETLAARANAMLYEEILTRVRDRVILPRKTPNILYVDYIKPNSQAWAASLLLNTRVVREGTKGN
jgi:hypothetical protein